MFEVQIIWDLEDDPDGNVRHVAEHGFSQDDVEAVLLSAASQTTLSKSSRHQITFGLRSGGQYIAVVWEHVADQPLTLYPITAFEVPEPRKRQTRK